MFDLTEAFENATYIPSPPRLSLREAIIRRNRTELKVLLSAIDTCEYSQREAVRIYRALQDHDATEGIKMPATLLVRAEIEGWL